MVVYCDFIAGCFGGACGTIVGHPFDTIKIWQQFGNRRISHSVNEIIMRNNGLNGFFRGMTFPVLTSGMLNSILFGVYGNELRRMQSMCATEAERRSQCDRHIFWAGSEAGFIHSFVACPFELVKIRLQTQNYHGVRPNHKHHKRGPLACIKQVYRNEGIFGFYRGWTAMFCRDVFPYGIYMLTYDHMSKTLASSEWILEKKKQSLKNYSYVEVGIPIASGVTAGLLSWIWAIPFDVIKTYMQAELDPNKHRQMSVMFENKRIKYGWRVFYRGSWIILVRSLPANAATFIGYQYVLRKCQYFSDVKPI